MGLSRSEIGCPRFVAPRNLLPPGVLRHLLSLHNFENGLFSLHWFFLSQNLILGSQRYLRHLLSLHNFENDLFSLHIYFYVSQNMILGSQRYLVINERYVICYIMSYVICYLLSVTFYMLYFIWYLLSVIWYMLYVICYL